MNGTTKTLFIFVGLLVTSVSVPARSSTLPSDLADSPAKSDSIEPVRIRQRLYDADNTTLGYFYYTNKHLDSTVYIRPNGRRMKVLFEIPEYQGGYDSLQIFFDERFKQIAGKEEHMNAMALVYILIERGKVTNVHIADRISYHNRGINYDAEIKKILRQTQGKWIIPKEQEDEPRLFVFLFTLD